MAKLLIGAGHGPVDQHVRGSNVEDIIKLVAPLPVCHFESVNMLNSTTLVQWPGWPTFFCLSFIFSLLLVLTKLRIVSKPIAPLQRSKTGEPNCYPPVESLPEFEWRATDPVKIRPFKPKYNLTMSTFWVLPKRSIANPKCQGIQEGAASELIEMDKNYLERIELRKQIMTQHPRSTLAADDCVKSAVDEFYTWLVGTYLPIRFPRMFQLHLTNQRSGFLRNLANDEMLSLTPETKPLDTLRVLGGLVDDDFLFLLPSEDGDGYTLKGFVTCFPNGFDTARKLNLKLRDIHTSVPQYKQKLERSMDRFFDKLQVRRFIKRANVSRVP